MKNWLKENWFKIGMLLILLVMVLIVAYYFLVYIPQRNNELDFQKGSRKVDLQNCLDSVTNNYFSAQRFHCKQSGQNNGCTLSVGAEAGLSDGLDQDKANCFKQYPQN